MSDIEQKQTDVKTEAQSHYKGVVLYTDGGCKPNPGNAGWGAHGYIYTTELGNKGTGLSTQLITEKGYIPMSLKNKTQWNVVQPLLYIDFIGSSDKSGTNNSAEIDALYYSSQKVKDYEISKIEVFTDSEYLRRGIQEWMKIWEARDWKKDDGSPIPNAESWKRLSTGLTEIKQKNIDFNINWVKGHSDNYGNTIADKHATIGVLYSIDKHNRSECTVSEAQGYWKNEINKHPFINFKRLYFNSSQRYNTIGRYYIAEPGGDDFIIGKKMPETSYSVIHLREPDRVIETIKQRQYDCSNSVNAIMMMRLDKVYSPEVYPYLEQHGHYSMMMSNRGNLGLNFVDNKPITVEIDPAGLSLRALECFAHLDELLDRFKNWEDNQGWVNSLELTIHDITDNFYEVQEKQKKKEKILVKQLKPEFVVGFKDLMVNVKINHRGNQRDVKIPLVLGLDLLPRNNLKRIEDLDPKISLLTWKESADSFRFAVIIEIEKAIGIWSNFYADKFFLN